MLKVLVGYECSGVVRRAFRARGFDAWSCDMQPADDGSPYHYHGDIWDAVLAQDWALGIFHPPCTYLTNSASWAFNDPDYDRYPGVGYHQKVKPDTLTGAARREAREAALDDIRRLMALPYPKAIENPRGFIGTMLRKPDQTIQPYEFGDDASKATCLWLDGLPRLRGTLYVPPRIVNGKKRWGNQTDSGQNRLSPSEDRAKLRSETYAGIGDAFADQWGAHIAPEFDDLDALLGLPLAA